MATAEKKKCPACGKMVESLMSMKCEGGEPTKPICSACFKKAGRVAVELARETTGSKEKTGVDFWPAPDEVAELVSDIMGEHHPELEEAEVGVALLFRHPPKESKGKRELAHTRKIPDHLRDLSGGYDFVTVIAAEPWDDMTEAKRRALIDHELEHIEATEKKDGTFKLSLRKHDLGDFVDVIQRRGFWQEDEGVLRMFQKQLFPETPKPKGKPKKGEAA